jgi:chaperonin GroES
MCYNYTVVTVSFTFKRSQNEFKTYQRPCCYSSVLEAETQTKSGIFIPDAAAEKPSQGEVLAAGGGRITEDGAVVPMDVKIGDRVLFNKHAGQTVKVDGEEYLILKEDDVMAIVE